jgi:hypothetical protein
MLDFDKHLGAGDFDSPQVLEIHATGVTASQRPLW